MCKMKVLFYDNVKTHKTHPVNFPSSFSLLKMSVIFVFPSSFRIRLLEGENNTVQLLFAPEPILTQLQWLMARSPITASLQSLRVSFSFLIVLNLSSAQCCLLPS